MNRMQREEAEVAIMIAEVLMECQNGFGVVGTEATQRHEPTDLVIDSRRELDRLTGHILLESLL